MKKNVQEQKLNLIEYTLRFLLSNPKLEIKKEFTVKYAMYAEYNREAKELKLSLDLLILAIDGLVEIKCLQFLSNIITKIEDNAETKKYICNY